MRADPTLATATSLPTEGAHEGRLHPANDTELSDADLDAIADRVVARLLPFLGAPSEALLTKSELAAHLRVKEAQIDRFVRRGMPKETVGASPRFRLAACREWLRVNARARSAPVARAGGPADGPIPGVTPLGRARRVR